MNSNEYIHEINRVAQQYRAEGYTVQVRPEADQIPPFLAEYSLDLIAIRGTEKVIVEVRPTRAKLATDPHTTRIAELTNLQPGWRFDLVVLEPENPVTRVTEKAQEPTEAEFREMMNRARIALESGLPEMALISAWAVLEGAMRRIRDHAELSRRTDPTQLLTTLYSNGFLSREEYLQMKSAWGLCTQAIHGFATPSIDPGLVEDVLSVASKLIGQEEPVAA